LATHPEQAEPSARKVVIEDDDLEAFERRKIRRSCWTLGTLQREKAKLVRWRTFIISKKMKPERSAENALLGETASESSMPKQATDE
jgi:hypothetical protein